MAILGNLKKRILSAFTQGHNNPFNQAFYSFLGGGYTQYDPNADVYLESGYLYNPTVYSVIRQMSDKAKTIPFGVKRIKDLNSKRLYDSYKTQTKGTITPQQYLKKGMLETKAFDEKTLPWPMERPNALQTWDDIDALYQVYLQTTGNFYLYCLTGDFKTEPEAVYVLPAHLMQIVLKKNASMLGTESPIDYYILTEGDTYTQFSADEVIHIKLPNPEYDTLGSHLYGLSPLRAALRNIQSSNETIDLNNRTLKNSGAFGFITGKNYPLTHDQADDVKRRLENMRENTDHLGQIEGASAELAFTQISLTTDQLKPFSFLAYDEKQICNVLGWDDKLLNNDAGAKYDNVQWAQKRVLINTVMPTLDLFATAMTQYFLPKFKSL